MAIRNDLLGGTDWSDGQVLDADDLNDTFDETITRTGTTILGEGSGTFASGASTQWIDFGNFTHTGDLGTKEIIVDVWVSDASNTSTSVGVGMGNSSGTTLNGEGVTVGTYRSGLNLKLTKQYGLTTSFITRVGSGSSFSVAPNTNFVVNATEVFYLKGKANQGDHAITYYWKARLVEDA